MRTILEGTCATFRDGVDPRWGGADPDAYPWEVSIAAYVLPRVRPVVKVRLAHTDLAHDSFVLRVSDHRIRIQNGEEYPLHELILTLRFRKTVRPKLIDNVGYRALSEAVQSGRVGRFQLEDMLITLSDAGNGRVTVAAWLPASAGVCTRTMILEFRGDQPEQIERWRHVFQFDGSGRPAGFHLQRPDTASAASPPAAAPPSP